MVDEADREKLVKILRMFSSDHDGEVASAARRAHELIKTRALDWDDLIIKKVESSSYQRQEERRQEERRYREEEPRYQYDQSEPPWEDEFTLIRKCSLVPQHHLNDYEREFIASIGGSVLEWGRLTPRQRVVLDRIVVKLKMRGVW
jgi:hypothetical protein